MKKQLFLSLSIVLTMLITAACGKSTEEQIEGLEDKQAAEVIFAEAQENFEDEQYKTAAELYEKVETEYPYSGLAEEAHLMSAVAYYKYYDYDNANAILQRFVRLYPNTKNSPYAYYLIAMTYYDQIADVRRDQEMTGKADEALRRVIARFPDSDYARDAKLKLDLVQDHLAGKEMEIGRYYLEREKYVAAINRFQTVIRRFQTTSHAAEALHRLVEAHLAIGIIDEAKNYAAVLGHNYPESKWYSYSYDLLN